MLKVLKICFSWCEFYAAIDNNTKLSEEIELSDYPGNKIINTDESKSELDQSFNKAAEGRVAIIFDLTFL
jgi:hypothetical protein